MATSTASEIEASVRFVEELFASPALRRIGIRFWNGTEWPGSGDAAVTLALKHPGALREMFAGGTEKALAEAFVFGDFDIEGDIEAAFALADVMSQQRDEGWLQSLRTYYLLHRLPVADGTRGPSRAFGAAPDSRHSLARDRKAVSFHYDVSNRFYELWLDRRMLYSCAYFEQPDLTLDEAQEAKLRHLCRKLRLRPGDHLLDIGCGWGGLAIYAAQNHGVRVTGVTLSRQQAEFAAARVRASGLGEVVTIDLRDYRELRVDTPFDAIVSVGMSEHVGTSQLATYFKTGAAMLKPGGVFLNHAIGEGVRPRPRIGPSFIDEYVFPDTDVPPIRSVLHAAESAGLEVRDVENLREHYALTLRQWVRRLEAAHAEALESVDEATYRVWRLYMSGSAHSFARGQLAVYQALLVKPDAQGRAGLPLTRADWYPAHEQAAFAK